MNTQVDIASAVETFEGGGAKVKRLFPVKNELMNYDPFVLWDHFELSPGSGFSQHPHRGFEAITYLFEGSIEHKDNLDNNSTVYAGGAQRFTAGRGIIHSEMPASDTKSRGIQVWINLPRHLKRVDPEYQQINGNQLTEDSQNGVRIRTIVGNDNGVKLKTDVQYLELMFEQNSHYEFNIPFAHRGFVYVVNGEITVDGLVVQSGDAYFFEQRTAFLNLSSGKNVHIMLISGIPHKQPIFQYGPYVD